MNVERGTLILAAVSAVVSALVASAFWLISLGEMRADVRTLKEDVATLKREAKPGVRVGDLCLKLMDASVMAFRTGDKAQQESVSGEMSRLGCYDEVMAATVDDDATEEGVANMVDENVYVNTVTNEVTFEPGR